MIYAGKTDRCLPKADFPEDWNVTYTESHWSNEDSMIEFIDKVLVPYVQQIRESLPLTQVNQKAIAIFDVFKAHRSEKVQTHLKSKGILPQFVPACCTDKLQPLDLSVNHEYKEVLKSKFHDWYAQQVTNLMDEKEVDDDVNIIVDLKTSTLKAIHARLVIDTHETMSVKTDLIQPGFRKAGLL